MIRVLVADDHAVVREGVKKIISSHGDMVVVAEACSGGELLESVKETPCDVVVMDLRMPGPPGLEVLRQLREGQPQLPLLVLSIHPEEHYAVRTLAAGASGYVSKSAVPDKLVEAIRVVVKGDRYVSPLVAQELAARVDRAAERPAYERLSNREFEVVRLMASGKSVGMIADELFLSVKTISTFRSRILAKLELHTTAEIIRYALDNDLA